MESVAPGHEVAVETMLGFPLPPRHERLRPVEAFQGDVIRLPDDLDAARLGPVEQVAHHLLLAVDRKPRVGQ